MTPLNNQNNPFVLLARNPKYCLRRSPWLYLLVSFFLLSFLQTFSYLFQRFELGSSFPFHSSSAFTILRPGDFHDSVNPESQIPSHHEDAVEQDDKGLAHDIRDERFYRGGTLTLTSHRADGSHPIPVIYDPYPVYNSWKWRQTWRGRFEPCLGPRGRYLDRTRPEDMVQVYKGKSKGFPLPKFGSYEALNLDGDVCTDRYSRFGVYGHDESNYEPIPGFQRPPIVDWDQVNWNWLQSACLERNANRYKPHQVNQRTSQHPLSLNLQKETQEHKDSPSSYLQYTSRSAVLIRSWHDMEWTPNNCEYLRSLIMELSLHSGAEFEVFLLMHVRDNAIPIFSDAETVWQLKENIPAEFRNMTVLFNDKLLEAWYPRLDEHSPKYQHLQPVQIFAQLYPDFDFYWQFELDARQPGHMYHFVDRAIQFAKQQPRKYLWERNAYFYTPEVHGPWEAFIKMVDDNMVGKKSVWGPVPAEGIDPVGPPPPVANPADDNYEWGVGEEADMITFLPIFNPQDTSWTFPNVIWNFPQGEGTPRRAGVITMGRFSNRLLNLIHQAQATKGLGLVSEMTGPSWSLFHGFKAVHVPHPIYADGLWTGEELARIYNPGPVDKINGGVDSIWNWNHLFDHIMYRLSYMFTTHTAEDLFRHWLGYKSDQGEGGQEAEDVYGRPCFPPMFLHTIKNTAEVKGPDRPVP